MRSDALLRCALPGCDTPIVRKGGGGRPRLYCCDAHRADARRRRLSGRPAAIAAADEPLAAAKRLLLEALGHLDVVARPPAGVLEEVVVAEARARVTEELLLAQQLAAEASRRAAAAEARIDRERAEWEADRRALGEQRATDAAALGELHGALEGARSELEEELVRHHQDVASLEERLAARAAAADAQTADLRAQLRAAEQRLAVAVAATDQAEHRAEAAEQELQGCRTAIVALEVRAARADEQARQAAERLRDRDAELSRLRAATQPGRRPGAPASGAARRRRSGAPKGAR
jgi:DNA repair exonuclease SbcCD ATPase subunit